MSIQVPGLHGFGSFLYSPGILMDSLVLYLDTAENDKCLTLANAQLCACDLLTVAFLLSACWYFHSFIVLSFMFCSTVNSILCDLSAWSVLSFLMFKTHAES